jgi:hypothetical protein
MTTTIGRTAPEPAPRVPSDASSPTRTTALKGDTMNRITAVTKLHFVNLWTIIWVPAIILGAILVLNIAVWWIVLSAIDTAEGRANAQEGFGYSGSTFYIFVHMMVVAVQAFNLTFPFALGYGVTRRDFYLGSSLAFVLLSLGWGGLVTLLAYIEQLTDGWGVGGRMFSAVYFGDGQWWQQFFLFTAAFAFFFFVGAGVATLYVRWKANGLVGFFLLLAGAVVGVIALIVRTDSWGVVGEWFATNGAYGVAAWSLLPAAVAAIAGYFVLQRATPKN